MRAAEQHSKCLNGLLNKLCYNNFMAIIKNLAFYQKNKLKNLKSFVGSDAFVSNFAPIPFDFINHILPLKLKFLSEAFVAIEEGKIKGLIALEKERSNSAKLKIIKLYLEENSAHIGEQLINYVISRYCAYGASSFYVFVSQELQEMAALFIDACKFRVSSYEFLYKTDSTKVKFLNLGQYDIGCFKNLRNAHTKDICDLHNSSINQHLAPYFALQSGYFTEDLAPNLLGGKSSFRYVLEDSSKKMLYGYFSISTIDNKNYILESILSPAFDSYFMDILNFAAQQISKRTREWNLYIKIKNYFMNSQKIIKQLESHKFELKSKNLILTKDFLMPNKQEEKIHNRKIMFTDATPAWEKQF